MLNRNIDVIHNRNVKNKHLSRKSLHLNDSWSKLLVKNFLEKIKLLLVDEGCSRIINDNCYDRYVNPSGKIGHTENHIEKDKGFGEIFNGIREKTIDRSNIGQ